MQKNYILPLILSIIGIFIFIVTFKISIGLEYLPFFLLVGVFLFSLIFIFNENRIISYIFSIYMIFTIGYLVLNSEMVRSNDYSKLVQERDANLSTFNTKEKDVRRVTLSMALAVADKLISSKVNGVLISSQYEVDANMATVQEVNGELVWVIPIDYSSFFKWLNNDHIPGYIKISATVPNKKPELVFDKKIILSNNGFFANNIDRQVWYFSGFKRTKTHFEINDKNVPYYISAILQPEIGFNADTVVAIIVTEAETGKMEKLTLSETKEKYPWIDRYWPKNIVKERIEWNGLYKENNFFEAKFVGENVSVPTSYNRQELFLVKLNNSLNWFTGMTSANSDKSLISVVMVEASSIEDIPTIHTFEMNQVSDESGALESIESKLPAKRVPLSAVLPQPYFVDNEFYWTATIISNNRYNNKAYIKGDDISAVTFNSFKKYVPQIDRKEETKETVMDQIIQTIKKLEELRTKYESM